MAVDTFSSYSNLFLEDSTITPQLHQVRMLGSHNSFHKPARFSLPEHLYDHPSLATQLDEYSLRLFEFDIHESVEGSHLVPKDSHRKQSTEKDYLIYHIPTYDEESTCITLRDCAAQLADWSDKNPAHLPIIAFHDVLKVRVLPDMANVDSILRSVWGDRLYTPAHLQNGASSLLKAVSPDRINSPGTGWPRINSLLGKVINLVNIDNETYS
eukprot:707560_1